jgi:hypothetical protein
MPKRRDDEKLNRAREELAQAQTLAGVQAAVAELSLEERLALAQAVAEAIDRIVGR